MPEIQFSGDSMLGLLRNSSAPLKTGAFSRSAELTIHFTGWGVSCTLKL